MKNKKSVFPGGRELDVMESSAASRFAYIDKLAKNLKREVKDEDGLKGGARGAEYMMLVDSLASIAKKRAVIGDDAAVIFAMVEAVGRSFDRYREIEDVIEVTI